MNRTFTRAFITIFSAVLITFTIAHFLNPEGRPISAGLITMLAILVVVGLSESFDYFQVGQLLHLKRNIEEIKTDSKEVKEENRYLRENIIALSNVISNTSVNQSNQKQATTTNFVFDLDFLKKSPNIIPATEEEVKEASPETLGGPPEETASGEITTIRETRPSSDRPRYSPRRIHEFVLEQTIQRMSLPTSGLIREAKFSFDLLDPIMSTPLVFDAYHKDDNGELFIEVITSSASNIDRYRIYVMLNKIFHYRNYKNNNAKLHLVLVKMPSARYSRNAIDSYQRIFGPAIQLGILTLEEVELSESEINYSQERQ